MRRLTVFVLILLLTLPPALAVAGGDPAPPQSYAFGKTLSEWQKLYWTWALGGSPEGQVDHVLFMPIPQGGELDVTLTPGTAFVLPIFVFIGESYVEDVPDDDPSLSPAEIFTSSEVIIKLDGHPLIDSSSEDISKYFFPGASPDGAVFFDEPIPYDPPQPRGPLTADAAVWVKGLGFVYPPLSVGEHTLTLFVDSGPGFDFSNTWRITVKP